MPSRCLTLLGITLLLAGCASSSGEMRRALQSQFVSPTHQRDLAAGYQVHHPDVLDVRVAGRPDCCGRRVVALEGQVVLAPGALLTVDGQTAPRIAARIARRLRVEESRVEVRVVEHNSQSLFLFGEPSDVPRVVPYRGPETVLDLLRRLSQIKLEEVGEVHVVRSHVADGRPPEVFTVDLEAILQRKGSPTDVRLQPGDRISLGQSNRAWLRGQLPPWLRAMCGGEARRGKQAIAPGASERAP